MSSPMPAQSGSATSVCPIAPIDSDEIRWYAVHCRSRHEKYVQEHLACKSLEVFLPLFESVHRWKDRRRVVALPIFPGYLFVRAVVCDRMKIATTPGVVQIVSAQGQPVPVPDHEIQALQDCYATHLRMAPHPYLAVGRRVLVKKGPFAAIEGILIRRRGEYRVVISINLIARSVALEVNAEDIVPVPSRSSDLEMFATGQQLPVRRILHPAA